MSDADLADIAGRPVSRETADKLEAYAAELIRWSATLLRKGAIGVFPKGKDVESELTLARQSWRFETDLLPSRTDPNARIVRIHHFDGPRA